MTEIHERLTAARKAAGYPTASAAAEALGVAGPTYLGHENGSRGLRQAAAERYARKFDVSLEWLLTGRGPQQRKTPPAEERQVPLVGYVSAGAQTHFYAQEEPLDYVPAPDGSSDQTVSVEIRGDSLGSFFDRWLVFYDDVRRPPGDSVMNKLCVVGLEDGRVLIKKVQRSKAGKGLFHLLSQTEPPILDVRLEWAARVKHMVPK
ncbi:XRE family transcriptional regulator [Bradyrhizobium sp. HKCCYLRH3099]|uniref:XRE family transcriptional regulator n=1 Tax=unclassified Bradyrhizobium TaxID=2631580 RepID=UPI003EBE0A40